MLPPKVINLLGKIVNYGWYCGFTPYKWNKKETKFLFDNRPRFWYRLLIQLSLTTITNIFLVVRCFQTLPLEDVGLFWKIRMVYMATSKILMQFDHHLTLTHYGEYQHVVTNFIQVSTDFHALYGRYSSDKEDGGVLTRNICLFIFARFFAGFTDALTPLARPTSPMHLTSLAENPAGLAFWKRALAAGFHLYVNAFHYYLGVLYASSVCAYVSAVLPMIKQLKCTAINSFNGRSQINFGLNNFTGLESRWGMTAWDFFKWYNQLAVLQRQVNSTFGFWILGFEMTHMAVVMLNLFQAVVLVNPRGLILAIIVGGLFLYLITHLAQVFEISKGILTTWRLQREPKWFPKWFRVCLPLRVNIGDFYYADNQLVLTIVGIIISNSVSLIVTYKVD